jgi:hypothetical protein
MCLNKTTGHESNVLKYESKIKATSESTIYIKKKKCCSMSLQYKRSRRRTDEADESASAVFLSIYISFFFIV